MPIKRPFASISGSIACNWAVNLRPGSASMSSWAGLPPSDLALKTFRQTEVDMDRVNVFNVDNIGTVFQVVSPTFTSRRPAIPSKGATIFRRAAVALASDSLACAIDNSAWLCWS